MFIQQAFQALTGYDGINPIDNRRGLTAEQQRAKWALCCLQTEGALAGLAVTAIYASNPENQGPGAGAIIPIIGIFSMVIGAQAMVPVFYVSRFRQELGLFVGNPLGYVVDGTLLGVIISVGSMDSKTLPFCIAVGTGMGAAVAAVSATVSYIAGFNR